MSVQSLYEILYIVELALLHTRSISFVMGCRLRCFYSKGAFLVLLWMSLVTATCWSLVCLYDQLFSEIHDHDGSTYFKMALVPLVPFVFAAPLAGWLADAHYGNFKVFKFGVMFLFLVSVLVCTSLVLQPEIVKVTYLSVVLANVAYGLMIVGECACFVTALQLGLDQMPDASSDNIISFINWLVFSTCFGIWTCDSLWFIFEQCAIAGSIVRSQIFSILPVIWMSILCCTMFLLASKWLTMEPKSPQSFKTIYQVLKFAWKHKSPLNRSALTYWEEDVPSRIDLGKSRYGGPFTTEQVEDVKTVFKILVIHTPFVISAIAVVSLPPYFDFNAKSLPDVGFCASSFVYIFTWSPCWCAMVAMLLTEFVVYPLVKMEPPSLLKRIGIVLFFILLGSIALFVAQIVNYFTGIQHHIWHQVAYSVYVGVMDLYLLISITLQFVCAQSPYNMRGLLSGYSICMHLVSFGVGGLVYRLIVLIFSGDYHVLINASAGVVLGLIGFVLHCVLARWYKRRVRDEDYQVQNT